MGGSRKHAEIVVEISRSLVEDQRKVGGDELKVVLFLQVSGAASTSSSFSDHIFCCCCKPQHHSFVLAGVFQLDRQSHKHTSHKLSHHEEEEKDEKEDTHWIYLRMLSHEPHAVHQIIKGCRVVVWGWMD